MGDEGIEYGEKQEMKGTRARSNVLFGIPRAAVSRPLITHHSSLRSRSGHHRADGDAEEEQRRQTKPEAFALLPSADIADDRRQDGYAE
jgi:hypothetical protein